MNHSTWRTTTATSHVIVTSTFLSRSIFIEGNRQAWGPKRERLVMYFYRALAGAIASVRPHRLEPGHARSRALLAADASQDQVFSAGAVMMPPQRIGPAIHHRGLCRIRSIEYVTSRSRPTPDPCWSSPLTHSADSSTFSGCPKSTTLLSVRQTPHSLA